MPQSQNGAPGPARQGIAATPVPTSCTVTTKNFPDLGELVVLQIQTQCGTGIWFFTRNDAITLARGLEKHAKQLKPPVEPPKLIVPGR